MRNHLRAKYKNAYNSSQRFEISSDHIPYGWMIRRCNFSISNCREDEDIIPTPVEEVKKDVKYNIFPKQSSGFDLMTGEVLRYFQGR